MIVEQGWSGVEDGRLLPVVLMVAPSNDVDVLRPLIPQVCALLPRLQPGTFYRVTA